MRHTISLGFLLLVAAGCGSGPVPNLESSDPYERYLGALEAGQSGDPGQVKKLEALLKDPDPLARTGAIVALSVARAPGALQFLTAMLSDPDPGVRVEAVRALAEFKDPASVEPISNLLASDVVEEPRRVAALALGEFADGPALRTALLTALSDRSAGVAFNAHRSLVRVTGRKDLPRERSAAEEALKRS